MFEPWYRVYKGSYPPLWSFGNGIALLLVTPVATALSRNAAFPLLLASAFFLVLSVALGEGRKLAIIFAERRMLPSDLNAPATCLAVIGVLYALISLLWSPVAARGWGALTATSSAACCTLLCGLIVARYAEIPRWVIWTLPGVLILACTIVISEVMLGSPIRAFLGASTEVFRLNRSAVALAIMMPLLFLLPNRRAPLYAKVALAGLIWIACFTSTSESAKLAVVAVSGVLALSIIVPHRLLVLLCGLGILASHALAPLLVTALYTFIPQDAFASLSMAISQHPDHFVRLVIWWAYAGQVLEAPFFGHGLQASFVALDLYSGADDVVARGLAFVHPHNFSIQVWYELGLVGVIVSTALIILLVARVLRLPPAQQPLAAAAMSGIGCVAFVSHGAWQHWWWALVGIVAILFVVLSRLQTGQSA